MVGAVTCDTIDRRGGKFSCFFMKSFTAFPGSSVRQFRKSNEYSIFPHATGLYVQIVSFMMLFSVLTIASWVVSDDIWLDIVTTECCRDLFSCSSVSICFWLYSRLWRTHWNRWWRTSIRATLLSRPVSLLSTDINISFTPGQHVDLGNVDGEKETDKTGESGVHGFFAFCKRPMVQSLPKHSPMLSSRCSRLVFLSDWNVVLKGKREERKVEGSEKFVVNYQAAGCHVWLCTILQEAQAHVMIPCGTVLYTDKKILK